MPAQPYFVIAHREEGDLWFLAEDENGQRWVIKPYQAKRFRDFEEAQAWARANLTLNCQVCESAF